MMDYRPIRMVGARKRLAMWQLVGFERVTEVGGARLVGSEKGRERRPEGGGTREATCSAQVA